MTTHGNNFSPGAAAAAGNNERLVLVLHNHISAAAAAGVAVGSARAHAPAQHAQLLPLLETKQAAQDRPPTAAPARATEPTVKKNAKFVSSPGLQQ